jgi:hypothetical protein
MGNIAIAFIEGFMNYIDNVELKKQRHLEYKRMRTLIPRLLTQLNNKDTSITTLDLSGRGVDLHILRLLSMPLIGGETRVQKLFLEHNQIGSEGATCIARIISKDRYLQHVSLAHNPGEFQFSLISGSIFSSSLHLKRCYSYNPFFSLPLRASFILYY